MSEQIFTAEYRVKAHVRKPGAIGVYYPEVFLVTGDHDLSPSQIRELWFAQYGEAWELSHFVGLCE